MTTKRAFLAVGFLTVLFCAAAVGMSIFLRTNVTRANFCRLQKGMTPSEVEEIFGEPAEAWIFGGSHRSGEVPLMWKGDGVAYVMFDVDRGLVYNVWSEEGFESVTKANFNRVEIGMTEAQVKEIFGKEPDSYWSSPNEVTTGRWHDIDGRGALNFDNGRVHRKWWEGDHADARGKGKTIFERMLRIVHLN